jgi:hypothetical protein
MKLLFVLLLASCSAFAQSWGTLNADTLVSMNTSTPGTTLTATIANAGTVCGGNCAVGTNVSWGGSAGNPTDFTVGTNSGLTSNLGPIQLTNGGTLYAAQTQNYNNLAHNDADNNTNAFLSYSGTPGTKTSTSILFSITIGAPYIASGSDWDVAGIWLISGQYYEAQINDDCNAGGEYGMRIETGHPTAHSAGCIPIIPQQTYWVSLSADFTLGYATLSIYTPNGTLVGQQVQVTTDTGSTLYYIQIGNNESANNSGTSTLFQNLMVNFSAPGFTTGTTATVTNGSPTVSGLTGAGSSWAGYQIILPGTCTGTVCGYTISSCASSTTCTLTTNYAGTTTVGSATWEFQPPYFWTNNALGANVLAPGRAATWNPGVPGGIPDASWAQCVTSACNTVVSNGASSTSAQISSAIASAPNNTYVSLPAGTYSGLTNGICVTRSNVAIRGAGANLTILPFTSASSCNGSVGASFAFASSDNNWKNNQSNGPVVVSGTVLDSGQNTITLASVPNLVVGNPIILDQLDTTADNGGVLVTQATSTQSGATSPGTNGPYSTTGSAGSSMRCPSATTPANCYSQEQIVTVTQCDGNSTVGHACSSGSNITISPALEMPNWSAGDSMYAWWATNPVLNVGIENVLIDSSNNNGALTVEMFNCSGCWVKGIASSTTTEAHVKLEYSTLSTVRDSYFFLTQATSTFSYGVEMFSGFDSLVENNIFQAVTTPMISNGAASGNVFGYNFTVNNYFTTSTQYNIPSIGEHTSGVGMNLYEGNITNGFTADAIHGTSNFPTLARNYLTQNANAACYVSGSTYATSTYGACNSGMTTIQDYSYHRFMTLVGNMLGQPSVNTVYNSGTATNTNVLGLGYGNGSVPSDQATFDGSTYNNINLATTMLWGNADSANGFSSPRFNCSEVPQFPAYGTATAAIVPAQFYYFVQCPVVHTIPASFYYSSKPYWWPSTKAWPIIGPDVNTGNVLICSGGAQSGALVLSGGQCPSGTTSAAANSQVVSNPAMDCYLNTMGGTATGTNGILTFSASACYSAAATVSGSFRGGPSVMAGPSFTQ